MSTQDHYKKGVAPLHARLSGTFPPRAHHIAYYCSIPLRDLQRRSGLEKQANERFEQLVSELLS